MNRKVASYIDEMNEEKYCTRLPAHWDSELFWIATNDQGKNLSVSGMH